MQIIIRFTIVTQPRKNEAKLKSQQVPAEPVNL